MCRNLKGSVMGAQKKPGSRIPVRAWLLTTDHRSIFACLQPDNQAGGDSNPALVTEMAPAFAAVDGIGLFVSMKCAIFRV